MQIASKLFGTLFKNPLIEGRKLVDFTDESECTEILSASINTMKRLHIEYYVTTMGKSINYLLKAFILQYGSVTVSGGGYSEVFGENTYLLTVLDVLVVIK